MSVFLPQNVVNAAGVLSDGYAEGSKPWHLLNSR